MIRKRFFLLMLCVIAAAASSAATQNYAPGVNYATQVQPRAVVQADFNGDGKPDLIVANSGSNTLSFFQGNGNGSFTLAGTIALDGLNPIALATADFNGDGKPDLVVTYNTSVIQLEVLLGNGDGTFQAPIAIPLPPPFSGSQGNGFTIRIGDFDGNGTPDIAISGAPGGILFFLNNGAAAFTTPGNAAIPSANVADFTVGDFNRDGHLDIAFVAADPFGTTSTLSLSLGNGDGTFQLPKTIATGQLFTGIACADFNGDGLLDLIYTDHEFVTGLGSIGIALQQSDGSFVNAPAINSVIEPGKVVVGDFNGDGNQDFAVIHGLFSSSGQPDEIVTFLGNRDGTFSLGQRFALPSNPIALLTAPLAGSVALDLAVVDFSADQLTVFVNQGGNTMGLTSSRSPEPADQPVTFQATVTPIFNTAGTPSGQVIFADGATTLGTATLNGSGVASLTVQLKGKGRHTIRVVYGGDSNFVGGSSATLVQDVVLGGSLPQVVSSVNPANFGQGMEFMASVVPFFSGGTPNPTGVVTLLIDGSAFSSATLDANAQATFSVLTLSVGNHTIAVSYAGDSVYNPGISAPLTQIVTKSFTTTALASSANPSVFGQALSFSAFVAPGGGGAGTPTGSVTFMDGTIPLGTVTLDASGQVSVPLASASVGLHSIKASYSGDSNFAPSTSILLAQLVNQANTTSILMVNLSSVPFRGTVTLTAQVAVVAPGAGVPTSNVVFKDGATTLGLAALTNGTASASFTLTAVGNHSLTAVYVGDSNFASSTSSGSSVTVVASPTRTVAASSAASSVFGQAVTFTATVQATGGGSGFPTGTVNFSDGGTVIGSGLLNASGKAQVAVSSLAAGSHVVQASYVGDGNYLPSSDSTGVGLVVNKSPTTSRLATSVNPSVFGQSVTFTAAVAASGGGGGVPSGPVIFLDAGSPIGTANLDASGKAVLAVNSLAVGSHSITVSYAGNGNFIGSASDPVAQAVNKSGSVSVVASSAPASVFGQSVSFTVTVSSSGGGAGVPSSLVTFRDGLNVMGTATLDASGRAVIAANNLSVGPHSITAGYVGDGNFLSSLSAALSQIVSKSPASATVSSSLNPSTFGRPVTFVVHVQAEGAGSGTPSGSVMLKDGGSVVATAALDNVGVAVFLLNPSVLAVGTHSITASYGGDANFLAAGSPALVQVVDKAATSIAMATSQNPTTNASSVLLSAAVTAAGGLSGVTGSVTFMDGSTSLGSGAVDINGKATMTVAGFSIGTHTLTATYSGDSSFTGSQSPAIAQTVVDSHSAVMLTSSNNPQTATKPVIFTAQLTSALGGPVTSGTLTFMETGKILGSASVANSSASFTTTALGVGNHQVIAVYQQSGTPGPFDGQSSPVAETIQPADPTVIIGGKAQDYALGLGTPQSTIQAGEQATTQLMLTPVNGLVGNVSVDCVGLPTGASCVVNPNPTALDGANAATATLTVQTTGAPITAAAVQGMPRRYPLLAGVLLLPLILMQKRLRMAMAVLAMSLLFLVGCGGARFETRQLSNATPAGVYTVVVQTSSGSLAHSATFTLTVK